MPFKKQQNFAQRGFNEKKQQFNKTRFIANKLQKKKTWNSQIRVVVHNQDKKQEIKHLKKVLLHPFLMSEKSTIEALLLTTSLGIENISPSFSSCKKTI